MNNLECSNKQNYHPRVVHNEWTRLLLRDTLQSVLNYCILILKQDLRRMGWEILKDLGFDDYTIPPKTIYVKPSRIDFQKSFKYSMDRRLYEIDQEIQPIKTTSFNKLMNLRLLIGQKFTKCKVYKKKKKQSGTKKNTNTTVL